MLGSKQPIYTDFYYFYHLNYPVEYEGSMFKYKHGKCHQPEKSPQWYWFNAIYFAKNLLNFPCYWHSGALAMLIRQTCILNEN